MPAAINFFALENHTAHLSGSGLGFFGSTFGDSVQIGQYQDSTFITNSNGTIEGSQSTNVKFVHPNSGSINALTPIAALNMPNYLATLNIRFTNDVAVRCQNPKVYIFDRVNINNNPSGVLCKVMEIVHPSPLQTGLTGSGSANWVTVNGSGSILNLSNNPSPGLSGIAPNGGSTVSARHDYFLNISCSPNSVGSKTFGMYTSIEYL